MAGKLKEIAYELSNLWNYLTRQELCSYYDITSRTLYNYAKKLHLPDKVAQAKQDLEKLYNTPDKVMIWVHDGNKSYKRQVFKNWEHFTVWSKAQPRSVIIDTMQRDNKKYVTCKFANKTPEALAYEEKIDA